MEKEKHMVTIPMSDYIELTKQQELSGIQKVKDGPIYDAIKNYLQEMGRQQYSLSSTPMIDINKVEIFVRVK